ncbi:MAG: hypothetical protein N2645_19220 [Clostridia bacterium]|nr:hypothetical protein [Clostridia bacterium]
MVSTLSLWSNYQSSLLPKDGIGINNKLSYAIIGEDGWSVNLFEECYQRSLEITVIGFCIFLIAVIFESFLKNGGLRGEDA